MKAKKKFLKKAGVLLTAILMVLISFGTVTTATEMNSSTVSIDEKIAESSGILQTVLLDEDFSGAFPPLGWTTDFWSQSFTNVAGGAQPEAHINKFDQYMGGQYYDNFIMTPPMDARNCSKIILEFKFAADAYYPQYCYFYVQYREDAASPWQDITPWGNPIADDFQGSYTIGISCGAGGCGTAFQVKWEYIGYYYYYNDFYLDDVKITCCESGENPSISVEKYIFDEQHGEWLDADTEEEAIDLPICSTVTFKIVVHNNGDELLTNVFVKDKMHDSLNYTDADPEPDEFFYQSPFYEMEWYIPGILYPCDQIEIYVYAHVEGPKCSYDYNYVKVFGEGCTQDVTDEDYAYVHIKGCSRPINRPILQFLQSHPNLFPILQKLIKQHWFGL